MSNQKKQSTEAAVREIRRRSRRKFSPEEKIRIVLEGLRGEQSIADLCRREGIASNLYYRWSKDFLEAGKKQLAGDTVREATSDRLVEGTDLPVRATLRQMNIPRSTFYGWYQRYVAQGFDGLYDKKPAPRPRWNAIPKEVQKEVLDLALERTDLSPRELACRYTDEKRYFVSESSVYRILKAADLITSPAYILMSASDAFKDPTRRVHEMWQTDFTYFRIIHWGWYYLSTVLDDFSRYIIAWKLSPTMGATDVTETLDEAIATTGVDQVKVKHRPRLLSDGPAYLSGELREYLDDRGMGHTRGAPYHPQTQSKIERYHRTMKNVVKLQHYYFPEELKAALKDFVAYYNNERYHESLSNVTPADVYFGRQYEVLTERSKIKRRTMERRKKEYLAQKAA